MAIVATQHRCALIGRPQDGVFSPADDPAHSSGKHIFEFLLVDCRV
jgi:hypothetical protein